MVSEMTESMQTQEFKEVLQAMMLKDLEDQKKSTLQKYRFLNQYAKKGQTVFTGSSLMEFFPIEELQLTLDLERVIYNRGVSGTTTADLLAAMDVCIFDLEPARIFINIGSNDIGSPAGYQKETLIKNYAAIMEQIKIRLPRCEVFVMAYYPVNAADDFGLDPEIKAMMFATRTNAAIADANAAVEALAQKYGFRFINANQGLADENGNLKKEYSVEGLHLWPNAYSVILNNLLRYL